MAQVVRMMKKTGGQKSRLIVPLSLSLALLWERELKKKDFPYTLLSSFSAEKSQPCSQPQGYT